MTHEYTFDVKLFATVTVRANSKREAREMLDVLDGAEANFGAWANGDPIIAPVSRDEPSEDMLIEIDGETV